MPTSYVSDILLRVITVVECMITSTVFKPYRHAWILKTALL